MVVVNLGILILFVEMGTYKMKARSFMKKGLAKAKPKIKRLFNNAIKMAIKK